MKTNGALPSELREPETAELLLKSLGCATWPADWGQTQQADESVGGSAQTDLGALGPKSFGGQVGKNESRIGCPSSKRRPPGNWWPRRVGVRFARVAGQSDSGKRACFAGSKAGHRKGLDTELDAPAAAAVVAAIWWYEVAESGGAALVPVVEPADFGNLDDLACDTRLDRPWPRRVLAEAQMCSSAVVVIEVPAEDAAEMFRV